MDCKTQVARFIICFFWLIPVALLSGSIVYDSLTRCDPHPDITVEIIVMSCTFAVNLGIWLTILIKRLESATLLLWISSVINTGACGFLGYRLYSTNCLSGHAVLEWILAAFYGLVSLAALCGPTRRVIYVRESPSGYTTI